MYVLVIYTNITYNLEKPVNVSNRLVFRRIKYISSINVLAIWQTVKNDAWVSNIPTLWT